MLAVLRVCRWKSAMSSMVYKVGGIAIGIAALAAIGGSFLTTEPAGLARKERIQEQANAPGTSNVGNRATETEAQDPETPAAVQLQKPVILGPDGNAIGNTTAQSESQPSQQDGGNYSGTVPLPQTVFTDDTANGGNAPAPRADPGSEE
jgi:hypothetical protein